MDQLDDDPKSGRTSQVSADRLIARVRELGATVQWILEAHVHADHLSAAPNLKRELGGQIGLGEQITTVTEDREKNIHVRNGISEEAFVALRRAHDATLGMPSVQVNLRAGQLPEPESNGTRDIKIPLKAV